ncbi:MAG: peptidoglycan-binding protein [Candidatus Paceibacterota bacterium]
MHILRIAIVSFMAAVLAAALLVAAATSANAQAAQAQTQVQAQSQSSNTFCPVFTRNLFRGLGDASDVHDLQAYLFARGYFSNLTVGPYGPLTVRAVTQFQRDNALPATGYFGPMTRSLFARLCNPTYPVGTVSIQALSPVAGPIGTRVTVTGSGFTSDNTIGFGSGVVVHVPSYDGTTLTFTVPDGLNPRCFYSNPRCLIATQQTTPGNYAVSVENTNGISNTRTFTVTSGTITPSQISIQSITPSSGPVGTVVTLTGRFFSNNNVVHFGGGAIGLVSVDSSVAVACTTDPNCVGGIRQTIHFTVPQSIAPYCAPGMMCAMYMQLVTPGVYTVYVTNENGSTNVVTFTVTGGTNAGTVSVNGLDAPTSLPIGVSGTWTVHATTNSSNTGLHYSVIWGDEVAMAGNSIMAPRDTTIQTSASFTHAYQRPGVYTPVFTVTDDAGHSATVSSTVTITPIY